MNMIGIARLAIALLSISVIHPAACLSVSPCDTESPRSAEWITVDPGPFSIRIPPGFVRRDIHGADSLIGQWVRGPDTISFNFGPRYSSVPEGGCLEEIASAEVRIAFTEGPDGLLRLSANWQPDESKGFFLSVFAEARSAKTRLEALAAVRSVVLQYRNAAKMISLSMCVEGLSTPPDKSLQRTRPPAACSPSAPLKRRTFRNAVPPVPHWLGCTPSSAASCRRNT